jgi:aspartate/tyrosine/aromatic aminotransferase
MGIINTDTRTEAQKATDQIKEQIKTMYAQIRSQSNIIARNIFKNSKATPQEIFNELGTDGVQVLQMAAAIIQIRNTFGGENLTTLVPAEFVLSTKEDGTILVENATPETP